LALPISKIVVEKSHLYLWCPNALLAWGLQTMKAWGLEYKTNIVWLKVRKDGGPDGRGVGFCYRNVTVLVLFGARGHLRTAQAGRRMVNVVATMKQRHSQKPEELYDMIEHCSPSPFLELFARGNRRGWTQWGDEIPARASEHSEGESNSKAYGRRNDSSIPNAATAPSTTLRITEISLSGEENRDPPSVLS
jgi:N6-adenosine-specific RNA methylase IME4